MYGPDGALIGQPLDRRNTATVVPAPLSPSPSPPGSPTYVASAPVSPAFDAFGAAAIEYMGAAGQWPPTPPRCTTTTSTSPSAPPSPPPAKSAGSMGNQRGSTRIAAPQDGYADLLRLLVSFSSSSSSSLVLHASDLRMEPVPYKTQGHDAFFRGRFGCTLPPPCRPWPWRVRWSSTDS